MFWGHCTITVIKATVEYKNKVNIYSDSSFNNLLSAIRFIIIFCEINFLA